MSYHSERDKSGHGAPNLAAERKMHGQKSGDRSEREPTYRRILDALILRLRSGEFSVDSALPTETELCDQYQASRYAVRVAVDFLEKKGYVKKRRRAGTRVLSLAPTPAFLHASGTRREFLDFVSDTSVEFSAPELVHSDARLARMLGCDELRRWYRLQAVRLDTADMSPIGVVDVYIDADRATLTRNVNIEHKAMYRWLEGEFGLKTALISQDITAVTLNEHQANVFGERVGAPSLRITRRYFDNENKLFQISVTTHRSEGFVFNTKLIMDDEAGSPRT